MTDSTVQARYGDAASALKVLNVPALQTMLSHRSIRHFLPDAEVVPIV